MWKLPINEDWWCSVWKRVGHLVLYITSYTVKSVHCSQSRDLPKLAAVHRLAAVQSTYFLHIIIILLLVLCNIVCYSSFFVYHNELLPHIIYKNRLEWKDFIEKIYFPRHSFSIIFNNNSAHMIHVLYCVQESMVKTTCKNFQKWNGPTLNSVAITREERPDSSIWTTFTRSFLRGIYVSGATW